MPAPAELIRKIRRIEITTRRAVLDTLAGGYHSVFKGRGMAFSEVRPYQPGDEIRAIDWNVTARIGEPFVKVFVEERELTALIAVDRSASQSAGLSAQAKAEVAAEIAALLVFSALENGDRAGLLLFTDRVERFVPPRRGRKHGLRLISEALAFRPRGQGTDVALALRDVTRLLRRRAVVFVVSDFLSADYEAALAVCARRHDVIPVVVSDPVEDELPTGALSGLWPVADSETGATVWVDLSDRRTRAAYAQAARDARDRRERTFRKLSLDAVRVKPGDDYVAPLAALFRARGRRR
ncbi:MAG TPA: DUF58 domain-containing protein [Myxococcales bacterium]|jgi:uncharacterized protein (DUF58 family)|nr:DUF58 domain-containing protein [Myxococcales bacterium]